MATDADGPSYPIEVQLAGHEGLVQHNVFYGRELVADQLHTGGVARPRGEIRLIHRLQELLLLSVGEESSLRGIKLENLIALADLLRKQFRARLPK